MTEDVPPYAIVGGNPAKILGYRFETNIIDDLLNLKWWFKDISAVPGNEKGLRNYVGNTDFLTDLTSAKLPELSMERWYINTFWVYVRKTQLIIVLLVPLI